MDADRYWLDWNGRFESGERRQRWQFDYEPAQQTPVN
jgi:hypothetical protein